MHVRPLKLILRYQRTPYEREAIRADILYVRYLERFEWGNDNDIPLPLDVQI